MSGLDVAGVFTMIFMMAAMWLDAALDRDMYKKDREETLESYREKCQSHRTLDRKLRDIAAMIQK